MIDEEELLLTLLILLITVVTINMRIRTCFARKVNTKRKEKGEFENLFQELKSDESQFFIYTRMIPQIYEKLFKLINKRLQYRKTVNTIKPEERLALTLKYLSSGDSIQSISWSYRVGKETARKIIFNTCVVIHSVLEPLYLKSPSEEMWEKISKEFYNIWQMPNTIGALDGKHISIQCPRRGGSMYYNYKHFHSISMMAICNAKYQFIKVNIGALGSDNDSGVFSRTTFGKQFAVKNIKLPPNKFLPGSNIETPHFLIGDEAFPLTDYLMRPYPGPNLTRNKKIFNYRLSRARRTIENAFGILAQRWRVFRRPFTASPRFVENIALACVCLHNFILKEEEQLGIKIYNTPANIDKYMKTNKIVDNWREESNCFLPFKEFIQRKKNDHAFHIRDSICDYFVNEGAVNWQYDMIDRGRIGFKT